MEVKAIWLNNRKVEICFEIGIFKLTSGVMTKQEAVNFLIPFVELFNDVEELND